MNLTAEIGNTRLKIAVFQDNEIVFLYKELIEAVDADFVLGQLSKFPIEKGILAGSGNKNNPFIQQLTAKYHLIAFEKTMLRNIKYQYKTPETLGEDRMLNAYESYFSNPNWAHLIIDCGTCLTFTFVDSEGAIVGGSISMGLQMRSKALHEYTENLPLIPWDKPYFSAIGFDTRESIASGIFFGCQAEIDERINYYNWKFDDFLVSVTGGDADFFSFHSKNKIFADSNLTLRGLNRILNES